MGKIYIYMNQTTNEKLCLAVVLNRVCEGGDRWKQRAVRNRDDGILHQDVAVGAVENGEILDVLGWP